MRACINYLESLPVEKGILESRLNLLEEGAIEDLSKLTVKDDWQKLRHNLHKGLAQGSTLRQMTNRLYYDLKNHLDDGYGKYGTHATSAKLFNALVAYGNVMVHIYTWPGDDYSFCDYLVATMRKEMKE